MSLCILNLDPLQEDQGLTFQYAPGTQDVGQVDGPSRCLDEQLWAEPRIELFAS